jgi:hypothetical protein
VGEPFDLTGDEQRCRYIENVGGNRHQCRLPLYHEGDHDVTTQNPFASSDEEAARQAAAVRGGQIADYERMPGNRLSIILTDGRHIIVRRPAFDDEETTVNPQEPPTTPAIPPFVVPGPDEPPVGTVLAYQRRLPGCDGERSYHYASIRAGDGRWYTTGSNARQGVDWHTLREVLSDVGTVYAAASWVPLFGGQ